MSSNSLLTLDETTLFYFSHVRSSDDVPLMTDIIGHWRTDVKQAPPTTLSWQPLGGSITTSTRSARSKTSATSVKDTATELFSTRMGGISDTDETQGPERDYAINSPLKGKKRLTSDVCFKPFISYPFLVSHVHPRALSVSKMSIVMN